jgi:uncharacterized protein YbaR (Trm112 family)
VHLSLSDLLVCPRCGPGHGLILMPARTRERRVEAGLLGCPNCRERYAIDDGVVELGDQDATARPSGAATRRGARSGGSPGAGAGAGASAGPGSGRAERVVGLAPVDPELAIRLAALLGLAEGGGPVVLAGPAVAQAGRVARLVDDVEVVALGPALTAAERAMEVTRVRVHGVIPFRGGAFSAVALTGPWSGLVREGLRVLRPGGRLLMDPAPATVRSELAGTETSVVLDEGDTVVVTREG